MLKKIEDYLKEKNIPYDVEETIVGDDVQTDIILKDHDLIISLLDNTYHLLKPYRDEVYGWQWDIYLETKDIQKVIKGIEKEIGGRNERNQVQSLA